MSIITTQQDPSTTAEQNTAHNFPIDSTHTRLPGTSAIRTENLTKTYGTLTAVNDLNIAVPMGVVAGFVGPNGSGKTTTIRMLLSLVKPTTGTVTMLGIPSHESAKYMPHVGAMIEGPAFYPGLSAQRNLEILATLGGFDSERVGKLLHQVGLAGRERDAVKTYSLGMRQRLGIAAALLPEPSLLVLDEPTNGLDPSGIQEIRQLIFQLHEQGTTILISSHLLDEIEQISDWIILLNKGKLIYQGDKNTLLASRHSTLIVGASNEQELKTVAAVAQRAHYKIELRNGNLHVMAPESYARELNRSAMDAGVILTQLTTEKPTLEETFFALTEGDHV